MPLYEYQCDACGHHFEMIRKFSDPPIETCPKCGGTVQKLMSSPAFQFKGTGWYVTDYAKKGGGETKGKDITPKDGKAEAKSEPADSTPSSSSTTPKAGS